MPGAEADGAGRRMQPQRAAAHKIKQMVGDGGVRQVGADRGRQRPTLIAQQHKRGLANGGRHVDDRIIGFRRAE